LTIAAQSKLLRFVQERTFRPIGSARFVRADVRIVAATNKDLESLVREGAFRSDLFFRLNVVRLHMVPLRERRSDVLVLARHFLSSLSGESGISSKTLSPAAAQKLVALDWPGNVRELCNAVQRAVVFAPTRQIQPSDILDCLPKGSDVESPRGTFREARARTVETFERAFVEEMLRQAGGNVTHAARIANKDRRVFGRLMKRYNISRDGV
jgi:DNA-binding NtrC family response regulator